jgi:hypothetical protein
MRNKSEIQNPKWCGATLYYNFPPGKPTTAAPRCPEAVNFEGPWIRNGGSTPRRQP